MKKCIFKVDELELNISRKQRVKNKLTAWGLKTFIVLWRKTYSSLAEIAFFSPFLCTFYTIAFLIGKTWWEDTCGWCCHVRKQHGGWISHNRRVHASDQESGLASHRRIHKPEWPASDEGHTYWKWYHSCSSQYSQLIVYYFQSRPYCFRLSREVRKIFYWLTVVFIFFVLICMNFLQLH